MPTSQIETERVRKLNDHSARAGKYVLYWMQQSQRARFNPALEFAVQKANEHEKRLLVGFGLTDDYPEANARHYHFMLEGLKETQESLHKRGIKFVLQFGSPDEVAIHLAKEASAVVCDRGYLRHQKIWREKLVDAIDCEITEVEGDAAIPVETVSDKAEYAARTIRPKTNRHRDEFLVTLSTTSLQKNSLNIRVSGESLDDVPGLVAGMKIDHSVKPVPQFFPGGTGEAKRRLRNFIKELFAKYDEHRSKPEYEHTSCMSPYLHFGQLSPVELAIAIRDSGADPEQIDSYLEELLVRRGLSQNFVYFTDDYDQFSCLPDWAKKTLGEHKSDRREHDYGLDELEAADTHDEYWNAAMREMKYTGYMHNYMRMYWGKKILEWSPDPEDAFQNCLILNNKYFLDGRDTNSYGNVAWVFGMHDRAWQERAIYGKIRCMMASGLERKCDIDAYVERVDALVKQAENGS
ncbi:deoxyribodipyrimidine photo-lyase [Stratiformator vulcanicus]|uniref:deoxyribodipyrimidine photo-lyase n=1 Tax=Stratiformator vulcanicus TaxID=2527980 RepID=UPI00119E8849|nr:deoxyribodipyrimidine photo-lyase [Stratiformator vulcanicus]